MLVYFRVCVNYEEVQVKYVGLKRERQKHGTWIAMVCNRIVTTNGRALMKYPTL